MTGINHNRYDDTRDQPEFQTDLEPSYEPDMAAILDGEVSAVDVLGVWKLAGEGLRRALRCACQDKHGRLRPLDAENEHLRRRKYYCLLWLIDAELVGGMSQAALARFLGVSKEMISREVKELEAALGFHGSGQKTIEQRKQFSAARMRHLAHKEHYARAALN